MVCHDRQRPKWPGWLQALIVLSLAATPAAAQDDDIYGAVDNVLNEAAKAREEGNCLAHGMAVGEAYRMVDGWVRNWKPGAPIEEILGRVEWAAALRRVIAGERDKPCGGVDPRSDAVMADVPSESLPGMHDTRQDPPPELQPVLDTHNAERAAVGAAPLAWNAQLQASATEWAEHLATVGRLEHAPREGRGTERENLQQLLPGTRPQDMLDPWMSEKSDFVPGVFPDVSRSGDWNFISHYSQMIWPDTTDIGCGVASGSGFDWLVCRYNPGGNRDGRQVGVATADAQQAGSQPPVLVQFELDADRITPQSASRLDGVAEEYKRTGQAGLQIQSNAADAASGDLLFNRLKNVHDYLIGQGVPPSAILSGNVVVSFARD